MTQDEALAILKTGANVFLTGEPGSGKTYTVNQFVAWLREHAIEPAVTASTGIAATHIGGFTIHSWSGIGIRSEITQRDIIRIGGNKRLSTRIKKAHTLIIDEVSMLSAQTLAATEAACRGVRGGIEPFGGLQVVLVGDFFQLPPVVAREENVDDGRLLGTRRDDRAFFAFDSPVWRALNLNVCYLTEQHRQSDLAFLEILSAIRAGTVSAAHRTTLQSRGEDMEFTSDDRPYLFPHNLDVDRMNTIELSKIDTEARTFPMASFGATNLVATLKKGCLSPETLELKLDARVMFTKNDHTTHRFVNGSLGTVVGFDEEDGFPIVKLKSGATITAEPAEWKIDDGEKILARIEQIPLRLAWAITVHKSQGMSLDAARMDLRTAFEHGQGYVAISRVRTLAGLSLLGLNERALEVSPEIRVKDATFRAASDAARQSLAELSAEDLLARQHAFIRESGGKIEVVAPREKSMSTLAQKPDDEARTRYANHLEKVREKYPNAYRPWKKEDDDDLQNRYLQGATPRELSEIFQRQPGSIRSRLVKLGLIKIEYPA